MAMLPVDRFSKDHRAFKVKADCKTQPSRLRQCSPLPQPFLEKFAEIVNIQYATHPAAESHRTALPKV
jgi:hypothetical protein